MASIAAESKATTSVNNGAPGGLETIPKTPTSHSLLGSRGSLSSWLNWKRILEVVVLSCVIIALWGPFLLPTIVYARPPLRRNIEETSINISFLCADNLSITPACLNATQDARTRTCAEGFYLENNSQTIVCVPLCDFWISTSELTSADDVIFVISMFVAIIVSVILLIVALWFQRDTILVFPTFYLIYTCITVALVAPILIAGVLGKKKVLCSSESFFESMENPTPFCTISGIAHSYLVVQITLWGTFHALGLCWGIVFPFHYRRFKTEGRIKHIHIITVILGLILPAVSALVPFIDGYTITQSPIDLCVGRNEDIIFFTSLLPISVLTAVSSSVLIILFWTIFKELILKQYQKNHRRRHVEIAEVKIVIIVCYYIIMACLGLSTFTYFIATDDETTAAFQDYFLCHSFGPVPDLDCGDPPNVRPQIFGSLSSVSVILISLVPLVNLIFTVKWTCKCFVKKASYNSQKMSHVSGKAIDQNHA